MLRLCLATLGSAVEKLSKKFTKDKQFLSDEIFVGIAKTPNKKRAWIGLDRLALGHTLSIPCILSPLQDNELNIIRDDLTTLQKAILPYIENDQNKKNHFRELEVNSFKIIDKFKRATNTNFENIFQAIQIAEHLLEQHLPALESKEDITPCLMGLVVVLITGNNLRLFEQNDFAQHHEFYNKFRDYRNLIAHTNSIGIVLEEINIMEALQELVNNKGLFAPVLPKTIVITPQRDKKKVKSDIIIKSSPVEPVNLNASSKKAVKPFYYNPKNLWKLKIEENLLNEAVEQNKDVLNLIFRVIPEFRYIKQVNQLKTCHIMAVLYKAASEGNLLLFDKIIECFKAKVDFEAIYPIQNEQIMFLPDYGTKFNIHFHSNYIDEFSTKIQLKFPVIVHFLSIRNFEINKRFINLGIDVAHHIISNRLVISSLFSMPSDSSEIWFYAGNIFKRLCEDYNIKINYSKIILNLMVDPKEILPIFINEVGPYLGNKLYPTTLADSDDNNISKKIPLLSILTDCNSNDIILSERFSLVKVTAIYKSLGLETLLEIFNFDPIDKFNQYEWNNFTYFKNLYSMYICVPLMFPTFYQDLKFILAMNAVLKQPESNVYLLFIQLVNNFGEFHNKLTCIVNLDCELFLNVIKEKIKINQEIVQQFDIKEYEIRFTELLSWLISNHNFHNKLQEHAKNLAKITLAELVGMPEKGAPLYAHYLLLNEKPDELKEYIHNNIKKEEFFATIKVDPEDKFLFEFIGVHSSINITVLALNFVSKECSDGLQNKFMELLKAEKEGRTLYKGM